MAKTQFASRAMPVSPLRPSLIYAGVTLGGFTCLSVVLWNLCTVTIPTGHRGVVTRFGKVQPKVLDEGFHLKTPIVSRVKRMNVQVQRNDVEVAVGTKDLQQLKAKLSLNWHLEPASVNEIYQNIGRESAVVDRIIQPAIHEVTKAATPKRTAEAILKNRAELKAEIDQNIEVRLASYGVIVDDVSLVNVSFSPEFTKSIEAKQIAEQEAKQAEYIAQKASQEAQAEINRAKGQAESQRLLRETLTPELLQKAAIEKWDGQFPAVITGDGTLPMINLTTRQLSQQ